MKRNVSMLLAGSVLLGGVASAQVDFTEFAISEALTVAQIEAAVGASDTTAIDGLTLTSDPDEIIIAHLDGGNEYTFASISLSTGTANWTISEAAIVADLNASISGDDPFTQLILEAEFIYDNGTVYFADSSVDIAGTPPFRFSVNALDVTVNPPVATNILLSADIEDWHTHGVLSDGTVVATLSEDFTGGEPSVGYLDTSVNPPVYVEVFDEDDFITIGNAALGAGTFDELPPEAVAVDPRNDNVYVFCHDDEQLFRVIDITGASPTLELVDIAEWNQSVDFHGMSIDGDGNLYAFDEDSPEFVRVWDRTDTFAWELSEIAEAINGTGAPQFGISTWRGIKARTISATQSEAFIASASDDYGVVRILFGSEPTNVNNWLMFD